MEHYSTLSNFEEDMDAKDFLQDPEMWEDKLPQPYRLINNILNDFLDLVWVKIEKKELLRQRAAAKVKVPSGTEGVALCEQVLTDVCGGIGCGEEVVVVGNGMSVCVLTDWNRNDSGGKNEGVVDVVMNNDECTNVEKKHLLEVVDMNSPISRLAFVQTSDVLIVVVQLATVVKVLALIRGTLTKIAEVSHLHRDKPSEILDITLSSTCSHLVVTFHCHPVEEIPTSTAVTKTGAKGLRNKPSTYASGGNGCCIGGGDRVVLGLYSLPIKAWVSEIHVIATQQISSTSKSHTEIVIEDLTFSKPLLLYFIPSPNPPSCVASDHATLFQSVCDEKKQAFPVENIHCLTDLYFENRWRQFISKRQDFLPASILFAAAVNLQKTATKLRCPPTCYFLYYKYGHKLEYPCEVAVWWDGNLQISVYPLQEAGKLVCLPACRRLPQASPIVCSTSSDDGSMLALALKSGVLVLWDIKTNFCSKVVSCIELPDVIVALKFFSTNGGVVCLSVGTEQGKVLTVNTAPDIIQPSLSTTSLIPRVKKQQEVCGNMFSCSGYDITSKLLCFMTDPHFPSLLTSVHADGSVVFWKPGEAVCRLALDSSSYSLHSPPHCSFTKDGKYLLVAGKKEKGECNLVSFDLLSTPFLSCLWIDCLSNSSCHEEATSLQREKERPLLEPAEIFLHSYTKSRYSDVDNFLIRWQERWEEFPKFLNEKI